MAKRENTEMTSEMMEQRVVAFAEQLGRIVGTVQAKTEGWTDREALTRQIASVRDSATELLDQMATKVGRVASKATGTAKAVAKAAPARNKGRSGGGVDAPGKKHRKPLPQDPRAVAAAAKGANMRSAKASMKTMKQRGRG